MTFLNVPYAAAAYPIYGYHPSSFGCKPVHLDPNTSDYLCVFGCALVFSEDLAKCEAT